jgi:peptidyl-prolyl cis-trans isomerase C
LRKAYDELKAQRKDVEEVRARHILVATEQEAKDLIAQIEGGKSFEDLAKQHSKDTGNKNAGGDLGYFTKEAMVKEFSDAAFKMNKGETSKTPIKTQFGWHVVRVEDKRIQPMPPFEQVREALAVEERRKILNELVDAWKKSSNVEQFDINGKPLAKDEPKKEEPKSEPVAESNTDTKAAE